MKKIFILSFIFLLFLINPASAKIIANEKVNNTKVETARKIIAELQKDMQSFTERGLGPFVAAIYDRDGNLVVKIANSVVNKSFENM